MCLVFLGSARGQSFVVEEGTQEIVFADLDIGFGDVEIGVLTAGNGLQIADGVELGAGNAYVGGVSEATNNWLALGANAQLHLFENLFLGVESSGNALIVTNGAQVTANSMGIGINQSATGNSVLVSGANLILDSDLVVGDAGSHNQMDVINGGRVVSYDGRVGARDSAMTNVVSISGTHSEWQSYGDLYIGTASNTGNRVVVSDEGKVVLSGGLFVEGTGNEFDLNDQGQLTVYSDFDASMAGFNFNEGGRLYVGGSLTGMTNAIDGGRTLGITGSTGQWNRSGTNIVVGGTSSGNTLYIEDGGQVMAETLFVGLGSNSMDNTVSVTGTNSLLTLTDSLEIGSVSNSGNAVSVSAGGKISVGNGMVVNGTNNTFNLDQDGWLVVATNFDASIQGFNFLSGGTLETTGELSGMTNGLGDGRSVVLTGASAKWNLGSTNLYMEQSSIALSGGAQLMSSNAVLDSSSQVIVEGSGSVWSNSGSLAIGTNSSYNTLTISNGGHVDSLSGMIGSGGISNVVLATGTGSLWMNSGNLSVHGAGNRLQLADGGRVEVGGALLLSNGAQLAFSSGGQMSASNYYQDAISTFSFDSMTNGAVDPVTELLAVDDTAEFESEATLQYAGPIDALGVGIIYTNLLVSAETLIVDGVTNAAGTDLDVLNGQTSGSLLKVAFYSDNDDLYAQITRARLAESAGFEEGTDMAGVSDEIDQMASDGNPAAINQLNMLTQLGGATQNAQLSQLYDRSAPTYAHANGMLEGFSQTRKRGVMPESMWPTGARGPHLYGDQVQGWIKGYGSWGSRDGANDFSTYDHSIYGMVVGIDKAFGELLTGLAGGYAKSDISQKDGDNSAATTGYGLLYASWGTTAWFGDLNLGYGRSSIDTKSGTLFDTISEFGADQLAFYAGGGKEFVFSNDHWFLTPSAGLLGSYYTQEGYSETATTAVARKVDAYDRWSMQSELGLKVSYQREYDRVVLMPETHANWLHEFNSDEQRVGYSLVGGSGHYTLGMQAPVENLFEVGLGLSLWAEAESGKVYEWAVGLDGRFGDGYSASALNARLLVEF